MRRVLTILWLAIGCGVVHVSASFGFGCAYGGSTPFAAVNGGGEMLVAWGEVTSGAPETHEREVCDSAVTPVAVGSPAAGFEDLGPLSAPDRMSAPTGVVLDEAGDGWVIGVHNAKVGENKYTGVWEWTSAWVAFRPAGARFRPAVKLPSKGTVLEWPMVAGNKAGVTLLAWSTGRGSYLAWGAPDGKITPPRFYGRRFKVAGIGVDEQGEAIVIGYYMNGSNSVWAKSVAAVTGRAYGGFSRPRVIAAEPRNARGQVTSEFDNVLAAVGPAGSAVIIWETWGEDLREPLGSSSGPSLLVYRDANGHFTRPRRIQKRFLDGYDERAFASVDAAGQALVLHDSERGWREVTVMPGGRLGPEHAIRKERDSEPALAGNERGETVIGSREGSSISSLIGSSPGAAPVSQAFATSSELYESQGPAVTIDGRGEAAAVWIETPQRSVTIVNARALAPGAQTVQVARGELTP